MIGIYKITNKINNKSYIGQSIDIEDRLRHHKSSLKHNRHENLYLQNAWNKYGENNFTFEILIECNEDMLDNLEKHYIQLYKTMNENFGYNFESGGNLNKHISEASRKKMSESKKGMYVGKNNPMYNVHLKHTEEFKRKMSERFSGSGNNMFGVHQKISEERKQHQSEIMKGFNNPFYGCKHTDETKVKMRMNNKSKKSVLCVETNTIYESCSEASRQTGIYVDSIIKCCNNKQHTAGNYHWKYTTQ